MSCNEEGLYCSRGKVPFSWENKPGISKDIHTEDNLNVVKQQQLPLPPCPMESPRISVHELLQVRLPPCTFNPPSRSNSRKGLLIRKQPGFEDPFVAAYKECTKVSNKSSKKRSGSGFWRNVCFRFSCKRVSNVGDDNLVRVSQLPLEPEIRR